MSQVALNQPSFLFGIDNDFLIDDDTISQRDIFAWDEDNEEHTDFDDDQSTDSSSSQPPVKANDTPETSYQESYQAPIPVYNMYTNVNVPFSNMFPRANHYLTQETILEQFPHLKNVNDPLFSINSVPENAQFYVMRSSNDDNIHKAIKYHMWSTTASGKTILSQAWNDFKKKGMAPEIYLIFSVVNTNHVLGVAKMVSDVNVNETFMYWWEPMKWFGSLQIKWLFIKDVHSSHFEHIKEDGFGSSSFINLKDTTKLSKENGREVLKIFKEYSLTTNIFESFAYMDQREDYIRSQRNNNLYFLKYFQECCVAYQKDPENYSPQKKTPQTKKKANNTNKFSPKNATSGANVTINFSPNSQKKQENSAQKKTYYKSNSNNGSKQKLSPTPSQNNKFNNTNNTSKPKETSFPLSLAEQFGIKTLHKKNKSSKKSNKDSSF
jgi:hypothetical protein